MIIGLDGVDCSGKSTASILLRDYLSIDLNLTGIHHVQMPGATALGRELRKAVKSTQFKPAPMTERLIFAADTIQFESEYGDIAPRNDEFVICDRFSRITDLIYGSASGLDLHTMNALQAAAGEKISADYYFSFQLLPEMAWERKVARSVGEKAKCRIEELGKEFFWKVAEQYNSLHASTEVHLNRSLLQSFVQARATYIIPVDATQSPKDIVKFIISKLPLPENKA